MRRSPNDPNQPQDQQRLLIFVLLSISLLMFSRTLFPPPPAAKPAGQQAQQEDADEGPVEPADDAPVGEGEQPGADEPANGAPAIENVPVAPATTLALGSAAADGPYRMLMTLSNKGATVRRLVLSSDEFSDIDIHSGSLGAVRLGETNERGVPVEYVPPDSAAAKAGLRDGDILKSGTTKKNAEHVSFTEDGSLLAKWLGDTRLGDNVTLTVESSGTDKTIEMKLVQPPMQLIRPEHENVVKHQEKLPDAFQDEPSFLVRLASVGKLKAKDPVIRAANKRLESETWTVDQQGDGSVMFTMRLADLGLEVVKRFALAKVPDANLKEKNYPGYHFDLEVEVRNLREEPQDVAYQIEGPNGLPIEGFWYANKVGRKVDGGGAWGGVGLRDVIVRYQTSNGAGPVSQMNPAQIAKGKYEAFGQGASLAYAGVDAQYFSVMMIPEKNTLDEVWFEQGESKLATMDLGPTVRGTLNNPTFTLTSLAETLAPAGEEDASLAHRFTVFAGPKRPDLLSQYFPADAKGYSLQSILYYGWFSAVAKLMLGLLHTFYRFVHNYGVAIVLLTVVVRLLMYPLSRKQAMNMVKMQELKPEIDRIAEKYKNDMEKRTKAQQDLFRKHNYNPMGGCLLMFIQLPIFLGLYRALAVDVELRESSVFGHSLQFLSNLAAPDMFCGWSGMMPHGVNVGEGFFGLGPYLNLLPIVTVVLFLLQQKMFMPEPTNEQAAMQQKMMKYMMGFMGFMFFKVPSGLCLYFITSSLWGITERKLLPHPKPAEAPPTPDKFEPKKPSPTAAQVKNAQAKKKKRKR